jgi:hypothetical protein
LCGFERGSSDILAVAPFGTDMGISPDMHISDNPIECRHYGRASSGKINNHRDSGMAD